MDHTDPDVLRDLYHGRDMTLREIADECNVSTSTILHHMKRHGIERRGSSEHSDGGHDISERAGEIMDADWLKQKYQDEGMSQSEIGDLIGVAQSTVGLYLQEHGIDARSRGQTSYNKGSMTEPEVIDVLTDVLDANGHKYETEKYLGDWLCDVYDTDTDTAYEAKGWGSVKPDLLKGIGQAESYLAHGAETAYVVVPSDSVRESHEKTFSTLRIGLIAIEEGSATVVSSCEAEYLS